MTNINKFIAMEELDKHNMLELLREHCKKEYDYVPKNACDLDKAFTNRFELIDYFGGQGKGDTKWFVWKCIVTNEFYKQIMPYNSYNGALGQYSEWWHVVPKEVVTTEYQHTKGQAYAT